MTAQPTTRQTATRTLRPRRRFAQRAVLRRHGYTLIEMVIGMALTMLLLLLAVTWTSTLIRTSSSAIELRSSARDSEYARMLLAEDLASARPCALDGQGWSLVSSNATTVAFYADVVTPGGAPGRDGLADLVVWEMTASTLERGVVVGTGSCPLSVASATRVPVVPKASADGAQPVFTTYGLGGGTLAAADCSSVSSSCDAVAIRLKMVVSRATAQDAPTTLDASANFARTGRWMP